MIIRALLLVFTIAALSACDTASDSHGAVVPGGKPKIEIVGGDSVNWGDVAPGVLKHVVRITNTGNDTLKISDVHPSCGCTTAPIDKNVLLPGDTASVEVSVDVAHSSGQISKNLTISSNDSTRATINLALKANLVREITAIPEFFPVGHEAVAGKETATSVALKNTGSTPVSVGPPRLDAAAEMIVRFEMTSPTVLQPGDSTTLVVHVKTLKAGVVSTDVIVPTDSPKMPTMVVRLTVDAK